MPVTGKGRIVIWQGASLWMLAGVQDSAEIGHHAHHAIQITLQLEGSFEIGLLGEQVFGPIVAVGSDVPHEFRASGAAAFLFLAPESAVGRAFSETYIAGRAWADVSTPLATALTELRQCYISSADDAELLRTGHGVIDRLPTASQSTLLDPRVLAMISYAQDRLADDINLPSAASHVCLSESRARHLFAAQTGLPFKSYMLWLRLQRALASYAEGHSLTRSAHDAGFADSAHFSRTFKRTFGLPANQLSLDPPVTIGQRLSDEKL